MYGVVATVRAPVEMYDALHAEMNRRAGASLDGLLVHIGRAHPEGFEVLEVWESEEHFDRANLEVVLPLMAEMAGDPPAPAPDQTTTAFDVRGLVIPAGGIVV